MTNKEAIHRIAELNAEIRMLRELKNDLLFYNRVVLCRECRKYKGGKCSHWECDMDKEGYCSYGER